MQNTIIEQAPQIIPVLIDPKGFLIQTALTIVAFLALMVALFQELIKEKLNKSKIYIEIRLVPPDCHQIDLTNTQTGQFVSKCIYIRIRATNVSKSKMAKNIEIITSNLWKISGKKKTVVKSFLPMNLIWAHTHPITITIPPKSFRLCDLGSFRPLNNKNTFFRFNTIVQPNPVSGGKIPNVIESGEYELETIVSGENVTPEIVHWQIKFEEDWSDNEDRMLKNISIKRVNYD